MASTLKKAVDLCKRLVDVLSPLPWATPLTISSGAVSGEVLAKINKNLTTETTKGNSFRLLRIRDFLDLLLHKIIDSSPELPFFATIHIQAGDEYETDLGSLAY